MGGVCHQGLSRTSHRLTRGPSQTVKGLTRQNMALNCTHLQASAYHTNPDNLSEYREAMCPLCLHFPVLLLFIIIISHQEKSAFFPSLPSRNTPPPPAPTHKNRTLDSLVKTIAKSIWGHAQLQHCCKFSCSTRKSYIILR